MKTTTLDILKMARGLERKQLKEANMLMGPRGTVFQDKKTKQNKIIKCNRRNGDS